MNGKAWKKWYKKTRPSKDDIRDVKAEIRWKKPVYSALKFAKKAVREMKKADPDSECGLWYDVHDGFGYRELCRVGGHCEARCNSRKCPHALAMALIRALEGADEHQ